MSAKFPPPPPRRHSNTPVVTPPAYLTEGAPSGVTKTATARIFDVINDGPSYPIAIALNSCLDISDADSAARALLTATSIEPPHLSGMLRALVAHEFSMHAEHPQQILRAQSLGSRALGNHARRVGVPFLRETIGPLVAELVALPHALEVDASRLADADTSFIASNVAALESWLVRCTAALTSEASVRAVPPAMRAVLFEMGRQADAASMSPSTRSALLGG